MLGAFFLCRVAMLVFLLWQTLKDCQSLRRFSRRFLAIISFKKQGIASLQFFFLARNCRLFALANLKGLPKFEAFFTPIHRDYYFLRREVSRLYSFFLWQTSKDCQSLRRFSRRFIASIIFKMRGIASL